MDTELKLKCRDENEFIAKMLEVKPMLLEMRMLARQYGDTSLLAQAEKLLTLFADDAAILHKLAQRIAKPDGSIEVEFEQEAQKLLRMAMGQK